MDWMVDWVDWELIAGKKDERRGEGEGEVK